MQSFIDTAKIIVAAVCYPKHVLEAVLAGADVTTMRLHVMEALFKPPLTDTGLKQFLADWKKVPEDSSQEGENA